MMLRVGILLIASAAGVVLAGCRREPVTPPPRQAVADKSPRPDAAREAPLAGSPPRRTPSPAPAVTPRFENVARTVGIDFTFYSDAVEGRFFLPEVMGGGAAWVDFDGDGRLDLYLMNGCELASPDPERGEHLNRLYRNRGGDFADVTLPAAAARGTYGQGCAVGDYDADGFPDLYLTNYGPDVLLHNTGDGTFEDVSSPAGVADPLWGSSAAWFDVEGDGDLDLYVVNYLDVTFENGRACRFNGVPAYCGPGGYEGVPDRLYVSEGDGTFRDRADELGFTAAEGKGLALAILDFDEDLRPEVYVANDMTPNFLFTRSDPAYAASSGGADRPMYLEVAKSAGCAVSDMGMNEASMGVACADFDGDEQTDIYLTHFFAQKNTLYQNLGGLSFADVSRRTRVAATSFDFLGFGTAAFDYDRDRSPDLFVANGHVLGPNLEPNEMTPQLLRNDGTGRFDDVSATAGPYFTDRWLGRGVAAGDYDEDGDIDLAVTHLDRPLALLRNDTRTGRRWVGFELRTPSRVPPVGGRVVVSSGGRRQMLPVIAGGSYLSTSEPRLVFGLGDSAGEVSAEIHWPSGRIERLEELGTDRYWRIVEGRRPEAVAPSGGVDRW